MMSLYISPAGEGLPAFPIPITCEITHAGMWPARFHFSLASRSGHTVSFTPPSTGRYEVRWIQTHSRNLLAQDSFLVTEYL
jgi:hypothetical protein